MAVLSMKWADRNLAEYGNRIVVLKTKFPTVLPRIVNGVGNRSKTVVVRTLTKQTGLPRATIVKAIGNPPIIFFTERNPAVAHTRYFASFGEGPNRGGYGGGSGSVVGVTGQGTSLARAASTRCFSKGAAMRWNASAVAPLVISFGMKTPERAKVIFVPERLSR